MLSAKFNTKNLPNPYGEIDPDMGDEYSIFKTIQADHIYEVPLAPSERRKLAQIDQFLDLGDKQLLPKQDAASYDTTKAIEDSMARIITQLSPTSRPSPTFSATNSTKEESMQLQLMENERIEDSYESSEDVESFPQKSFQVPKTKRIRSYGVERTLNRPPKEKRIKKPKKDERKNMYGYSFKFIVKEFLSDKYKTFYNKLCVKFGVTNLAQVRDFYEEKLKWSISLKDLRSFLNFNQHSHGESLRAVKQTFHSFYVWYMRKRYTLHILTEDKIVHKEPYLEAKNYLIYLPELKTKKCSSQNRKNSSER